MNNSNTFNVLSDDATVGEPLASWTYSNPELFNLEYEAFFLRRWQFVGHVNEVRDVGDFITHDIGRDNVFVIRGKDGQLRAFKNVCRHRASRVLQGLGTCRGVIRCPYHGWTYRLDGTLMAIPQDMHFDDVDLSTHGLHQIKLDVMHGFIFVLFAGDAPPVAEYFGHTAHYFEKYDVANYVRIFDATTQVWDVNWKVAWDNYLENYHIPIGHPGLNRLLSILDHAEELDSGVSYGVFDVKSKLSSVDVERQYQESLHHADQRLPDELRGKWVQFGFAGNLGIDLYPEMLDIFQLIPMGPEKTIVRAAFYGHANATPEEKELRRLNLLINTPVNAEDKELCTRVQQGLRTKGYSPGPLSYLEGTIFNFHEMVRELVPVTSLSSAPPHGQVAPQNSKLLSQQR